MAIYDHGDAIKKNKAADKYTELKKFITSQDDNGILNDYYIAHDHLIDMEREIKKQKEQLNEYRNFFSIMRKLIPNNPSTNTFIN
jgi:hypothetical protein